MLNNYIQIDANRRKRRKLSDTVRSPQTKQPRNPKAKKRGVRAKAKKKPKKVKQTSVVTATGMRASAMLCIWLRWYQKSHDELSKLSVHQLMQLSTKELQYPFTPRLLIEFSKELLAEMAEKDRTFTKKKGAKYSRMFLDAELDTPLAKFIQRFESIMRDSSDNNDEGAVDAQEDMLLYYVDIMRNPESSTVARRLHNSRHTEHLKGTYGMAVKHVQKRGESNGEADKAGALYEHGYGTKVTATHTASQQKKTEEQKKKKKPTAIVHGIKIEWKCNVGAHGDLEHVLHEMLSLVRNSQRPTQNSPKWTETLKHFTKSIHKRDQFMIRKETDGDGDVVDEEDDGGDVEDEVGEEDAKYLDLERVMDSAWDASPGRYENA